MTKRSTSVYKRSKKLIPDKDMAKIERRPLGDITNTNLANTLKGLSFKSTDNDQSYIKNKVDCIGMNIRDNGSVKVYADDGQKPPRSEFDDAIQGQYNATPRTIRVAHNLSLLKDNSREERGFRLQDLISSDNAGTGNGNMWSPSNLTGVAESTSKSVSALQKRVRLMKARLSSIGSPQANDKGIKDLNKSIDPKSIAGEVWGRRIPLADLDVYLEDHMIKCREYMSE